MKRSHFRSAENGFARGGACLRIRARMSFRLTPDAGICIFKFLAVKHWF